MKRLSLVMLLFLGGCIEDQQKQAATCQLDGARTYPTKTLRGSSPSIELADYIQACMSKEGYVFSCGYQNLSSLPSCYEPSGAFAKWTSAFERKFKGVD